MCSRRSIRCQGSPERESSWVSRGKTTMAVGRLIYLSARNNCSPPESCGVVVGFPQHKKDWSVDVLHKRNCRPVAIVLRVFKRWCFEPIRLEQGEVSGVP